MADRRGRGTSRGDGTRRRILAAIAAYTEANRGRPPTQREVLILADVPSLGQLGHHLRALIARGYLRNVGGSRGLIATFSGEAWLASFDDPEPGS